MKPSLEKICADIPRQIWDLVTKTGSDMKWKSWWNLRWYADDGHKIDGTRSQCIRDVEFEEEPYNRSHFGPSGNGRFGLINRDVAYFGSDHATATCETMKRFREKNSLTSEEVRIYLRGESLCGESAKGYPEDLMLAPVAKLADLRRNDNAVFKYIVEAGEWVDCNYFADNLAYSKNEAVIPETKRIAQAAYLFGFDGIWYRSVRTPSGMFITSGECIILFEGRESLLCPFGSIS